MKICFINLKFEKDDVINFRRQEHTGIGYIASACMEKGFEISIINAQFDNMSNSKIIDSIIDIEPDIVAITVYEEMLLETIEIIKKIKKFNCKIKVIIGGHYATFNCENLINGIEGIDYISLGEGELSFPELLDGIIHKKDLKQVRGLCFIEQGTLINTGIPEVICDLDSLKYPVRKKINRSNCITNISASRGCYGSCSFCSTRAFNTVGKKNHIRIRNPVKVVDEIEYLVKEMFAYRFFFTDDNFMVTERLQPGWIEIFIDEIKKRKLNIKFNFDCRVDDINEVIFGKLKEIGLIGVFLGVESNSENTLRFYNKSTSVEKNMDAVLMLRKLRIDCWMGNIMFHPLTTFDDIEADIKFLDKIKYCLYFNYSNPVSHLAGRLKIYKGTKIYQEMIVKDLIKDNGFFCDYKFFDSGVEKFYNFIQISKQIFQKIINLDPIYLIEIANKQEKWEVASKIHTLSRKYMKIDFEIFKESLKAIRMNSELDIKELYKTLVNEDSVDLIYGELRDIYIDLTMQNEV